MDLASSRVIVTGGAGFIGSHLVKRLSGLGANVTVLDNLFRGSLDNLMLPDGNPALDLERGFRLVDLSQYGSCLETVRDADVVFHLADIVGGVHFAFANETFIYRQNTRINTNVLAACEVNGIENYVYVGTACSFPKHLQMQEGITALREEQTYPAEPESSYGWSKLMGEYEAELAARSGRMNVGILRLHNVFGPFASYHPSTAQVLPSLIRKAIAHPAEPFVVWGSGNQYRDFIYVEDVVDALVLMAGKGMNEGLIQVGSSLPTTIREAAEQIIDISGKAIEPRYDETMPSGDRGRIAVCERAKEILGWRHRTDFQTGLESTYDWIQARMRA